MSIGSHDFRSKPRSVAAAAARCSTFTGICSEIRTSHTADARDAAKLPPRKPFTTCFASCIKSRGFPFPRLIHPVVPVTRCARELHSTPGPSKREQQLGYGTWTERMALVSRRLKLGLTAMRPKAYGLSCRECHDKRRACRRCRRGPPAPLCCVVVLGRVSGLNGTVPRRRNGRLQDRPCVSSAPAVRPYH